ncbi:MAG: NAD(P)H-hydrate dehydratase [Flavobacteriales bacterium]|nr:NAD(P)H-hydrate dehydratase [Flavobacteriales bacterium]
MLPVLSYSQIRRLEAVTMEQGPLTVLDLMEMAGAASAQRIIELHAAGAFGDADRFLIVVGMGNNGGDGLVIARLLHSSGLEVRVLRILHRGAPSPEHAVNHRHLLEMGVEVADIDHSIRDIYLYDNEVIIDSLLGAGISRSPEGLVFEVIAWINGSGHPVVAIDLPSGSIAPEDGPPFAPEACVHAHCTLTLEVPKLGLLLPESGQCAGRLEILPIGLNAAEERSIERIGHWVRAVDLHDRLRPRPRFGHKGTFGHCLVGAGAQGMFGAAVLAVKGCLRSGVGLVTAHVPGDAVAGLMAIVPDAMSWVDPCSDHLSSLPFLDRFNAVALGPGCGQHTDTAALVEQYLRSGRSPLVLDADALGLLASKPEWLDLLGPQTVLTPHPKEMDRLLGSPSASSYERLHRTQAFAERHRCNVVLKGAYSVTCTSDGQLYFNSTGNAGMAKGGSGDVLTGLIAGLLAQGYSMLDACLIGVYLHGSAGDIAADELGMDGMRPSDLVDALPKAWKKLRSASK